MCSLPIIDPLGVGEKLKKKMNFAFIKSHRTEPGSDGAHF